MNQRVMRLRERSLTTRPSLSVERAELVTQAHQQWVGKVSEPVLRAKIFAHVLANKALYIGEDELIVGERGPAPLATPTYPELCCHTLEDLEVIASREKISFEVDERTKLLYAERIIPYWQGRSIRDRLFAGVSPQWLDCYSAGIFTEFMEQRAPGHTVADGKIYRQGFWGFKRQIARALENLDLLHDPEALDKREELLAMDICCDAMIGFAQRYSDYAAQLADQCPDPVRRAELKEIARVCAKVPAYPAESFREALQSYWFLHLGVITELNTWDSFNPGRLDQHLIGFYRDEVAAGTLDEERALEYLGCFWVKFNNQPAPPKVGITLLESGTYTDFANINIGGLTADGSDGVNEVSYLLLKTIEQMHILQPSTNIQLSRKSPDAFLEAAAKVIRRGWGQPSVFNADAVVQELLRQGKDIVDARCGGTSGCVEAGAFGKEAYILTGYFNLPKVLEITLNDGFDPISGKQLGPHTGKAETFADFDALMDAYAQQVRHFIDIKMAGNHVAETLFARQMPCPFLSVTVDDCIAKGKDYNAGGARYNTSYIQGVGIGSITDALSAIKTHIFERKELSMGMLMKAMAQNFEGQEALRLLLKNRSPRYGNDEEAADDIMQRVFDLYYQAVNGRPNRKGGVYRIDMLPTTCHVYFGAVMGASADGRHAGQPLSEGISPVQGADRNGPTAVVRSAAKMDHLRTGGTLLNLKFTPKLLADGAGIRGMMALVRGYFNMDGHHIQFNVVDRQTLLDAQAHPEAHQDLIVRVAGYSDYFNNLTPQLQQEIIDRTAHEAFG